jgi:integrase
VAELRSLLTFLYVEGLTPCRWRRRCRPWRAGAHDGATVGDRTQVQDLLDSCDRTRAVGVRDFAILMLVARLGLRSAEVARMELGDIAWRVVS